MGILSLLDEECWFPRATDKSYTEKLHREHSKNAKFSKPDFRSKSDFILNHYAGEVGRHAPALGLPSLPHPPPHPLPHPPQVDYCCEQWLMKNMDPLNDNVVSLLSNSTDWFVAALWKDTANIVSLHAKDDSSAGAKFGGQRPRKGMFRTVGQLYKVGLYSVTSLPGRLP